MIRLGLGGPNLIHQNGKQSMTARIRWINHSKGYGFLSNEDYKDIFFHYSQVENQSFRTLQLGEELEFDLYQVDAGYEAKSVRRIK